MKRRELLKGLAVASVAMVSAKAAIAEEKAEGEKIVEYLFVQNAASVTLKDGVMTMKGIATDTLYFSDRPDRITGRITTQKLVDKWGEGEDSFKKNPPNAVLAVLEKDKTVDIVVELLNPRLDGENLIYDVIVLDGDKMTEGTMVSLFIDVVGRPLTPVSVAGVSRRTTRRTVRRLD